MELDALRSAFAATVEQFVAEVNAVPPAAWEQVAADENWTVAAVARHIAWGIGVEAELIAAVLDGRPLDAIYADWANLHALNAENAQGTARCTPADVLALTTANAGVAHAVLQRLTPHDLSHATVVPILGQRTVTVANLVEWLLIGHIAGHLASMRAAVAQQA